MIMRTSAGPQWTGSLTSLLLLCALLVPSTIAFSLPPLRPRAVLPVSAQSRAASLPAGSSRAGDFVCRSTGECSACPARELGSPVCKIYGNRRPLTCIPVRRSTSQYSGKATLNSAERTDRSSHIQPRPPVLQEDPAGLQGPGLSEATVEEALELDPDPEGLDDEDLQDALRGELAVEDERARRKRSRRWESDLVRRESGASQEIFTWEACARVVTKERADFFEFVLCNLFFATISVAVLIYRHRALASRQFGTLAARIGMSVS